MNRVTLQALFDARERRRQAESEAAAQDGNRRLLRRDCLLGARDMAGAGVVASGGLWLILGVLLLGALLRSL